MTEEKQDTKEDKFKKLTVDFTNLCSFLGQLVYRHEVDKTRIIEQLKAIELENDKLEEKKDGGQ